MTGPTARSLWIAATILRHAVASVGGLMLPRRGETDRLVVLLEDLGGVFPKFGQLLSTRPDVLPEPLRARLRRLQDTMAPRARADIDAQLQASGLAHHIRELDPAPLGSATVAQVHRAIRADTGSEIALKFVRPGVGDVLAQDCRFLRWFTAMAGRLPLFRSVPLVATTEELSELLVGQVDMLRELGSLTALHAAANGGDVTVPRPHPDLTTSDILCMDYVAGLIPVHAPSLTHAERRRLSVWLVRALYEMIFVRGVVHCDLHPGNAMRAPDGRLVLLDAGLCVRLTETARERFARFFGAIVLGDAVTACGAILDDAVRLPPAIDTTALESQVRELLDSVRGKSAGDFLIADFVARLFGILRSRDIRASTAFTIPILALMTLEGTLKEWIPDMDFQQEALPYLAGALAARSTASTVSLYNDDD